jgi:hypothetical protein
VNASVRAGIRKLVGPILLAPLLLAARGASTAAAQDVVPPELRGDWVAVTLSCDAPVRFRSSATRMSLINGGDTASWGDVAIAYSFFGPEYDGIQLVAMPDFNSGSPPFTVTFNFDEKRGAARVDIFQETANPDRIPAVEAIQAAARALAERFPMNAVELRMCPAPEVPGPG